MARRSRPVTLELGVTNAFVSALFTRALGVEGIPQIEAGVLWVLAEIAPAAPGDLEAEMGLPAATLRDRVRSLEAGGYVSRSRNPSDRRSFLLTPTPSGTRLLRDAAPVIKRTERALERALGWPLRDMKIHLEELRQATQDVHGG